MWTNVCLCLETGKFIYCRRVNGIRDKLSSKIQNSVYKFECDFIFPVFALWFVIAIPGRSFNKPHSQTSRMCGCKSSMARWKVVILIASVMVDSQHHLSFLLYSCSISFIPGQQQHTGEKTGLAAACSMQMMCPVKHGQPSVTVATVFAYCIFARCSFPCTLSPTLMCFGKLHVYATALIYTHSCCLISCITATNYWTNKCM